MHIPYECSALSDSGNQNCANCLRRRHSLFRDLSGEELAILEENRYTMTYQPGETIIKEGAKPAGLFCLREGKVKVVRKGIDDNEQIVGLKKPGDFIGFKALVQEQFYSTSAIALETCSVCVIDQHNFNAVMRHNARLPFEIIRELAKEIDETNERFLGLTRKHMRARLADSLFWVYDIYGTQADNTTLDVSLKRADLAALSNMTTANAIRILSSFSKENLIEIDQRKIKIKNLKGLRAVSLLGR